MTKFTEWAPRMMRDLIAEPHSGWNLMPDDAAAIVGNGAHESAGFEIMQEIKPTVKGSAGGYGVFQWTGPRRRAFEAWAKRKGWHVNSYEANYSFLIRELLTTEKKAIPALKKAVGLNAKTKAFELAYERAGVKHYTKRYEWAAKALAVYQADQKPLPSPTVEPWPKYIIAAVQWRLKDLGYANVGKIDGILGPVTRRELKSFQEIEQLPPTGEIDEATIRKLGSALPIAAKPAPADTPAHSTPDEEEDVKPAPEPAPQRSGLMTKDTAWMMVRYLLIAGFGVLTGAGYMTDEQVQMIVGAAGTLFPIIWGLFVKSGTVAVEQKVAEARNIPVVSSASGRTEHA